VLERNRDLTGITGYAVLAAGAAWGLHPLGLAGLLLAPLLVVCPGYSLVRAIEGRHRPDLLELAVTTVALSFATAALGGLVLNTLHLGLTAHTWSALFLIVTLAAAAVAACRRVGADEPDGRFAIQVRATPLLAAVTIAALLAAAAVVAIRSQQAQDRRTTTAALSVVTSNGGSTLRISVVNGDAGARHYQVRLAENGASTSFPLLLARGERWSGVAHVDPSVVGRLRIELFRATQSTVPLRTVILPHLYTKPGTT
jgi:hypothetical protein